MYLYVFMYVETKINVKGIPLKHKYTLTNVDYGKSVPAILTNDVDLV